MLLPKRVIKPDPRARESSFSHEPSLSCSFYDRTRHCRFSLNTKLRLGNLQPRQSQHNAVGILQHPFFTTLPGFTSHQQSLYNESGDYSQAIRLRLQKFQGFKLHIKHGNRSIGEILGFILADTMCNNLCKYKVITAFSMYGKINIKIG